MEVHSSDGDIAVTLAPFAGDVKVINDGVVKVRTDDQSDVSAAVHARTRQ